MKVHKEASVDGKMVIRLVGDFDALGAKLIRTDFEEISVSNQFERVVIDISGVDFMDSSGVGAIVFLYKRLLANASVMEITGVRGQPAELLQLLRIGEAIPIAYYDDDGFRAAGAV